MSGSKICPQCGVEYERDQRFCPKDGTTLRLADNSGDLVGAIVADRYHVLRKLGEGGMGQVYLAEHVKMGRKSALKVMNPGLVKDADAISRFNREASNASRINHPHVADVYDFGETKDGIIYLAMEFVDGPSLTQLMSSGEVSPRRSAEIVRQTADALAAAHDMGIVHRDLKPDNIMVARARDGADCVKVVDFGIAKAAENPAQKVTKTGLVVGTPEYMSPEQLAGDKLDGRSDIYALALVAFNMLTGRLPFPADTVQESMIMRLTEQPRKLSEMRPEVGWPTALQEVLDRALERDASKRYQSASEFGRDFALAIDGMVGAGGPVASQTQPITAALPETRVRESGRGAGSTVPPPRRAKVLAGIGGVILIAALSTAAIVMMNGNANAGKGDVTGPRDTASLSGAMRDSTPLQASLERSVDSSLDSIEGLQYLKKDNALDARTAISRLNKLDSVPMTEAQRLRARVLRAEAHATLGEKERACRLMKTLEQTKYARRVSSFLSLGCS